MKKNSTYDIDGNLYEFDNGKLKAFIKSQNSGRGGLEKFYHQVMELGVGIGYDTVKGWVTRDTNPPLEDVKRIAEILEIPYMKLLKCTHYSADGNHYQMQKIKYEEIVDPFCLKYDGFSNVLDMIIGHGYNKTTGESKDADFAERIMSIICYGISEECDLQELMGYKLIFSEEEFRKMPAEKIEKAINSGLVDKEGSRFYDDDGNKVLDRKAFGRKLLENVTWIDEEERLELKKVLKEADEWWDLCDMPFALLTVNINIGGTHLASYTYGPGWKNPTHKDRWAMILDILCLMGSTYDTTGLCWLTEMKVNQFESRVVVTIETIRNYELYHEWGHV